MFQKAVEMKRRGKTKSSGRGKGLPSTKQTLQSEAKEYDATTGVKNGAVHGRTPSKVIALADLENLAKGADLHARTAIEASATAAAAATSATAAAAEATRAYKALVKVHRASSDSEPAPATGTPMKRPGPSRTVKEPAQPKKVAESVVKSPNSGHQSSLALPSIIERQRRAVPSPSTRQSPVPAKKEHVGARSNAVTSEQSPSPTLLSTRRGNSKQRSPHPSTLSPQPPRGRRTAGDVVTDDVDSGRAQGSIKAKLRRGVVLPASTAGGTKSGITKMRPGAISPEADGGRESVENKRSRQSPAPLGVAGGAAKPKGLEKGITVLPQQGLVVKRRVRSKRARKAGEITAVDTTVSTSKAAVEQRSPGKKGTKGIAASDGISLNPPNSHGTHGKSTRGSNARGRQETAGKKTGVLAASSIPSASAKGSGKDGVDAGKAANVDAKNPLLSSREGKPLSTVESLRPKALAAGNQKQERKTKHSHKGRRVKASQPRRVNPRATNEAAISAFAVHETAITQLMADVPKLEDLWNSVLMEDGGALLGGLDKIEMAIVGMLDLAQTITHPILFRAHQLAIDQSKSRRSRDDAADAVHPREFPRLVANVVALSKLLKVTGMDGSSEIAIEAAGVHDLVEKLGVSGLVSKTELGAMSHDELTLWFTENGCKFEVDLRAVAAHFDARVRVRHAQHDAKQALSMNKRSWKGAVSKTAGLCHRYDELRHSLFEIVLDYNRLAALWDEISGDVEEVSAIHAAKLLSEKFILLSSPIAAERVANLLCDSAEGSPNVHLETWPHFLVHLASLNLVIGIFGEGAGRVGTAAFKRITIKLGLKFSAKELDQVFRQVAKGGHLVSMIELSKWFALYICTPHETRLFAFAAEAIKARRVAETDAKVTTVRKGSKKSKSAQSHLSSGAPATGVAPVSAPSTFSDAASASASPVLTPGTEIPQESLAKSEAPSPSAVIPGTSAPSPSSPRTSTPSQPPTASLKVENAASSPDISKWIPAVVAPIIPEQPPASPVPVAVASKAPSAIKPSTPPAVEAPGLPVSSQPKEAAVSPIAQPQTSPVPVSVAPNAPSAIKPSTPPPVEAPGLPASSQPKEAAGPEIGGRRGMMSPTRCKGTHSVDGSDGCHDIRCKGKVRCMADCKGCPDKATEVEDL